MEGSIAGDASLSGTDSEAPTDTQPSEELRRATSRASRLLGTHRSELERDLEALRRKAAR